MSNYADAVAEIRSHFYDRIRTSFPDLTVFFDNQRAKPPEGLDVSDETEPEDRIKSAWCRITVVWGQANQADMSKQPRIRTQGTVIVQVFVPVGSGDGLALRISDEVCDIFRRARLAGMTFRAPHPSRVGPDDNWYQINVVMPMHYDFVVNG